MTISLYETSVPRLAVMLRRLDAILATAQAHPSARKIGTVVSPRPVFALDA